MRTVRIISGTYGHKPKASSPVTPISIGGTVDLHNIEAARLVALKVAVYADKPKFEAPAITEGDTGADSPPGGVATPGGDENSDKAGVNPPDNGNGAEGAENGKPTLSADDGEADDFIPEYNEDMPQAELKELFDLYDLTFKVGMSKADMVEALDDLFSTDTLSADDGEAPPDLETEEPVT